MTSATFYLLEAEHTQESLLTFCCQLTSDFYQQGLRIFILARDKTQAELIDELLWQQPVEYFVPHVLVGENSKVASIVEIGWQSVRHLGTKQVLINLSQEFTNFAPAFTQVIDFVPCDEALKNKARERYKIYRMAGRNIQTQAMTTL